MQKIKTQLGDTFYFDEHQKRIISDRTGRHFGANDLMIRLVKSSEFTMRSAERLRTMDEAPGIHSGKHFLINDAKHEGFSRPIALDNPDFSYESHDYNYGAELFYNENTDYFVREFVGSPGSVYGPYFIHKYCYEFEEYLLIGEESEWDNVANRIEQAIAENLQPLPPIKDYETSIIPMKNGCKAEVIEDSVYENDVETLQWRVFIIDKFNRRLGEFKTDHISCILQLRDDASFGDKMAAQLVEAKKNTLDKTSDIDGILGLFARSETHHPGRYHDFSQDIKFSPLEKVAKFLTADSEYEILLTRHCEKEVYRDMEGNLVSVGMPTAKNLDYREGKVFKTTEEFHTAYIKRADGVLYTKIDKINLSIKRLYKLLVNPDVLDEILDSEDELVKRIPGGAMREQVGESITIPEYIGAFLRKDASEILKDSLENKRAIINVQNLRKGLQRNTSATDYNY